MRKIIIRDNQLIQCLIQPIDLNKKATILTKSGIEAFFIRRNSSIFLSMQPVLMVCIFFTLKLYQNTRAYLKIYSCQLHTPFCGIFGSNSVSVAHYTSLIGTKSPTNCNAQLAESNFQTRSRINTNRFLHFSRGPPFFSCPNNK